MLCADRRLDPLQPRRRAGVELARPASAAAAACRLALGRSSPALRSREALLDALDGDLQALALGRLEHVVDDALLEGLDRVLVVGGDEDDLRPATAAVAARRVSASSSSTGSWAIARAASTPVMPGMRMSRKTRSGWCCSVSATASAPFFASATISSSGQTSARRARSCSRSSRSSSAMTARSSCGVRSAIASTRARVGREQRARAASRCSANGDSDERRARRARDEQRRRRAPSTPSRADERPSHERERRSASTTSRDREQQRRRATRSGPCTSSTSEYRSGRRRRPVMPSSGSEDHQADAPSATATTSGQQHQQRSASATRLPATSITSGLLRAAAPGRAR